MNLTTFLLDVSTPIIPSGGGTQAAAPVADAASQAAQQQAAGGFASNPFMVIIMYCVIIFAVMYFFSIRPTRKREQKLEEMRNAISVGDTVVLNSGLFGKVADITAECFVIEFGTNKGVKIPVLKQEVFGKREPNLSNKEIEQPKEEKEKKGFLGLGKKKEESEQ